MSEAGVHNLRRASTFIANLSNSPKIHVVDVDDDEDYEKRKDYSGSESNEDCQNEDMKKIPGPETKI